MLEKLEMTEYSLWTQEEPVQPDPWEQQNNNANGQAKDEPVPKVDRTAARIEPIEYESQS